MTDYGNEISSNALYGYISREVRSTGVITDETGIKNSLIKTVEAGITNPYSFEEKLNEVEASGQNLYLKKAGASFDSVYSPYSTYFGAESGLPNFEIPTNRIEPNSLTLNPFNPNNSLSLYYAPSGSDLWLNSLADTGAATSGELAKLNSPSGWTDDGHTISWAVVGTGDQSSLHFETSFTENSGTFVEVENIRAVGFRSPMVLTGWGFDVDGKPVPNEKPDAPTDVFATGAFSDVSNWKSGPLDVRWDDERKVWAAGTSTKIYLVKTTNTYNPSCFSYEVQRSTSRAQYTRDTLSSKAFSASATIHDPEYLAYTDDPNNAGCFERLDFDSQEYPHYEAFIIRETKDETDSNPYYNIWTDDCHDCGHIANSGCGTQHGSDSTGKKILIENPLRQSLNVGDLAFTVKTGRKEKVNTGSFTGGTGTGASGNLVTDASGNMSGDITAAGSGYQYDGFAIISSGDICTNVSLAFGTASSGLSAITVSPTGGFVADTTYPLSIYPNDATTETEELDIHWILQAEFKSQQITTHVECDGGILQTCTTQIQTQGFKTCEWCGEDLTLINNTI